MSSGLPLFDRFSESDLPDGGPGSEPVDEAQMRESVITEVTRLLNTRSIWIGTATDRRRTVVDYGLPDFTHYSPHNPADANRLARLIKETIDAYEPRLMVESVSLALPRRFRDQVEATISGAMRLGAGTSEIVFPVSISGTLPG